ncbi:MAG: hypothetical protein AAB383_04740 [Patescibacteria group bacterium]
MDKFLESRVSQPKADVARYVEANGILVPRRFSSVSEGLASGADLIVRSEHPIEYEGPSGLFHSAVINATSRERARIFNDPRDPSRVRSPSGLGIIALKKRLFKGGNDDQFDRDLRASAKLAIDAYCWHARADFDEIAAGLTYSVWELVGGMNHTVVADSTVPSRYHVFSFGGFGLEGGLSQGYVQLDLEDGVVKNHSINLPLSSLPLDELIATYDKVRRLEAFDPNHCPAVEMQSNADGVHFLQYHRTRDFKPAEFTLEEERDGWVKALMVRGATPSEGRRVDMTFHHDHEHPLDEEEQGSFGFTWAVAMEEIGVRRRCLHFKDKRDLPNLGTFLLGACEGHSSKSSLFKPEVSVVASMDDLKIPEGYKCPRNTEVRSMVPLEVIADGRNAFVRFAE